MTTLENQSHDPDMTGTLRRALAIAVIGIALGIGYNAMGLASRPHRGLAWIKQPEKVESLEALQAAPGGAAAAGSQTAPAGAGATSESSSGDAQAATSASTTPEPAKSTPAAAKHDTSTTAAKHDTTAATAHGSKSAAKKSGAASGAKTSTTSKKSAPPLGSTGTAAAGTKAAD